MLLLQIESKKTEKKVLSLLKDNKPISIYVQRDHKGIIKVDKIYYYNK